MGDERVAIDDVRALFGKIGPPERISADLPMLRYDWDCGCAVVVDSDAVERTWERCADHRMILVRQLRAS